MKAKVASKTFSSKPKIPIISVKDRESFEVIEAADECFKQILRESVPGSVIHVFATLGRKKLARFV